MNTTTNPTLTRGLAAAAGGFALIAISSTTATTLQAAPFLYGSGDLLLAVRQKGNAVDLIVNLGKAANFANVPAGTTLTIGGVTAAQLTEAFPSLNGIQWSVAGANRPPGDANYPLQTLWVSAPRQDASSQSNPWVRKGSALQGNAASQIDAIGLNSASYSSAHTAGTLNAAALVAIPTDDSYALAAVLGDSGNLVGNFQGSIESATADDFDSDTGNVSRSDLYELLPGSLAAGTYNTAGRYLGYFELKADGTLSFNAGTPALTAPTITAITREGNVTTVSFTSVANATYKLRSTNAAGLATPSSAWTVGATATGTGSVLSIQDTTTDAARFYAVEVQ